MVTVVTKTIGTGGDYSSINAWEAATGTNLVSADEIQRGTVLDETLNEHSNIIAGAITDATRYRELTAASGAEYDPDTDSGARIVSAMSTTLLTLGEHYTRVSKLAFINTYSGTSLKMCVRSGATESVCTNLRLDAVMAAGPYGSNNNNMGFRLYGARAGLLTNCLAVGDLTDNSGLAIGFYVGTTSGYTTYVYNCVAFRISHDTYMSYEIGRGFYPVAYTTLKNCIAASCEVGDFRTDGVGNVYAYNCSSDSTATGTGSLTSKSAASVFTDAVGNDFTLAASSPCENAGTDLSGTFTTDFIGATHGSNGTWEMGLFDVSAGTTITATSGSAAAGASTAIAGVRIVAASATPQAAAASTAIAGAHLEVAAATPQAEAASTAIAGEHLEVADAALAAEAASTVIAGEHLEVADAALAAEAASTAIAGEHLEVAAATPQAEAASTAIAGEHLEVAAATPQAEAASTSITGDARVVGGVATSQAEAASAAVSGAVVHEAACAVIASAASAVLAGELVHEVAAEAASAAASTVLEGDVGVLDGVATLQAEAASTSIAGERVVPAAVSAQGMLDAELPSQLSALLVHEGAGAAGATAAVVAIEGDAGIISATLTVAASASSTAVEGSRLSLVAVAATSAASAVVAGELLHEASGAAIALAASTAVVGDRVVPASATPQSEATAVAVAGVTLREAAVAAAASAASVAVAGELLHEAAVASAAAEAAAALDGVVGVLDAVVEPQAEAATAALAGVRVVRASVAAVAKPKGFQQIRRGVVVHVATVAVAAAPATVASAGDVGVLSADVTASAAAAEAVCAAERVVGVAVAAQSTASGAAAGELLRLGTAALQADPASAAVTGDVGILSASVVVNAEAASTTAVGERVLLGVGSAVSSQASAAPVGLFVREGVVALQAEAAATSIEGVVGIRMASAAVQAGPASTAVAGEVVKEAACASAAAPAATEALGVRIVTGAFSVASGVSQAALTGLVGIREAAVGVVCGPAATTVACVLVHEGASTAVSEASSTTIAVAGTVGTVVEASASAASAGASGELLHEVAAGSAASGASVVASGVQVLAAAGAAAASASTAAAAGTRVVVAAVSALAGPATGALASDSVSLGSLAAVAGVAQAAGAAVLVHDAAVVVVASEACAASGLVGLTEGTLAAQASAATTAIAGELLHEAALAVRSQVARAHLLDKEYVIELFKPVTLFAPLSVFQVRSLQREHALFVTLPVGSEFVFDTQVFTEGALVAQAVAVQQAVVGALLHGAALAARGVSMAAVAGTRGSTATIAAQGTGRTVLAATRVHEAVVVAVSGVAQVGLAASLQLDGIAAVAAAAAVVAGSARLLHEGVAALQSSAAAAADGIVIPTAAILAAASASDGEIEADRVVVAAVAAVAGPAGVAFALGVTHPAVVGAAAGNAGTALDLLVITTAVVTSQAGSATASVAGRTLVLASVAATAAAAAVSAAGERCSVAALAAQSGVATAGGAGVRVHEVAVAAVSAPAVVFAATVERVHCVLVVGAENAQADVLAERRLVATAAPQAEGASIGIGGQVLVIAEVAAVSAAASIAVAGVRSSTGVAASQAGAAQAAADGTAVYAASGVSQAEAAGTESQVVHVHEAAIGATAGTASSSTGSAVLHVAAVAAVSASADASSEGRYELVFVELSFPERAAKTWDGEPVQVGVPLPVGRLASAESFRLSLVESDGTETYVGHRITGQWADGSVRWLAVELPAPALTALGSFDATLCTRDPLVSMTGSPIIGLDYLPVSLDNGLIEVSTATGSYKLFNITGLATPMQVDLVTTALEPLLQASYWEAAEASIVDESEYSSTLERIDYFRDASNRRVLRFTTRVTMFRDSEHLKIEHSADAVLGSHQFTTWRLTFPIDTPGSTTYYATSPTAKSSLSGNFTLRQVNYQQHTVNDGPPSSGQLPGAVSVAGFLAAPVDFWQRHACGWIRSGSSLALEVMATDEGHGPGWGMVLIDGAGYTQKLSVLLGSTADAASVENVGEQRRLPLRALIPPSWFVSTDVLPALGLPLADFPTQESNFSASVAQAFSSRTTNPEFNYGAQHFGDQFVRVLEAYKLSYYGGVNQEYEWLTCVLQQAARSADLDLLDRAAELGHHYVDWDSDCRGGIFQHRAGSGNAESWLGKLFAVFFKADIEGDVAYDGTLETTFGIIGSDPLWGSAGLEADMRTWSGFDQTHITSDVVVLHDRIYHMLGQEAVTVISDGMSLLPPEPDESLLRQALRSVYAATPASLQPYITDVDTDFAPFFALFGGDFTIEGFPAFHTDWDLRTTFGTHRFEGGHIHGAGLSLLHLTHVDARSKARALVLAEMLTTTLVDVTIAQMDLQLATPGPGGVYTRACGWVLDTLLGVYWLTLNDPTQTALHAAIVSGMQTLAYKIRDIAPERVESSVNMGTAVMSLAKWHAVTGDSTVVAPMAALVEWWTTNIWDAPSGYYGNKNPTIGDGASGFSGLVLPGFYYTSSIATLTPATLAIMATAMSNLSYTGKASKIGAQNYRGWPMTLHYQRLL